MRIALIVLWIPAVVFAAASCLDVDDPVPMDLRRASALSLPTWVAESEAQVGTAVRTIAAPLLSASERLVHASTRTVKDSGFRYHRIVIFDAATQQTRKITISDNGQPIDEAGLFEQLSKAAYLASGNLDPALLSKISKSPATYAVEVTYHVPFLPERPISLDDSNVVAYQKAITAALKPPGDLVENDLLAAAAKVTYRATYSPTIRAEISSPAILALAWNPAIKRIAEHIVATPYYGAAQSTTDLSLQSVFYSLGYYGSSSSIRVGISGEGGNNVGCGIGNPYFFYPGGVHYNSALKSCTADAECSACSNGRCHGGKCTAWHGTLVAGMLGHLYGFLFPRGAPAVQLYFVSWLQSHQSQLDWFFGNAAFVENESWINPTSLYYQDYYAILGLAVTTMAWNWGANQEPTCNAGNTICVASYDSLTQFSDFTSTKNFTSCSRFVSGCDREVPYVTFHGGNAVTTTNNPGDPDYLETQSGTSLATPAAVGLIALMHDRWKSMFWGAPEVTRAALMASADIDVHHHPDAPADKTYSDYRAPDERDGAGTPNPLRLQSMMSAGRVQKYTLYRDSSFNGQGELTLAQVYLTSGQRLRSVVSWTACPMSTTNGTHADIDMSILSPSGATLFTAASYDNSYEIGEIVIPHHQNQEVELARLRRARREQRPHIPRLRIRHPLSFV